ncbi:MAG: putative metal-binding motif-containing protein, partial [Nanoarchaeota archaeon]|nr:putative metal-binding motif-containing protein [Nanoarchaeota archaeon]
FEIGCHDELDCNDNNPEINPAAREIPNDGIDNDCNGIVDDACTDSDNDGFNSTASAGGVDCGGAAKVDCDDANFLVNPGMAEICGDGIDNNCNGYIDGRDPACVAASAESECEIDADRVMWISCEGDMINSANEGDTVYMIIMGEGCDEDADVRFEVYEYSRGRGSFVDRIVALEPFTNISDPDGNPTDIDVWIAPWVAAYIRDDDGTAPEYYFEAKLRETGGAFFSHDSGKTEDTLLAVSPCDGCGIECILDMGGLLGGNGSSGSAISPPCQKTADCSGIEWSECNPATQKMARNTSLCTLSGTGTVECGVRVLALLPSERLCSSSASPSQRSTGGGEAECGDGICDEGEECPGDCGEEEVSGGFPLWWILIAIIVIGAITTGIILVYKKKTKAAAVVAKPGEKKEEMPFAAQKDLDAILAYIRAAKGKGYNDAQITDALKKAGWKDDQVKYAFNKINNPQQANKPAQEVAKPANGSTVAKSAQTSSQQAAQKTATAQPDKK